MKYPVFQIISHWMAILIAIPLIRFYKLFLSPIAYFLGSRCRFYPTCSGYAEEAFKIHGFFKGFFLSFIRLAKCNPLHPGGFDPVPPKKTNKNNCLS